MPESHAKLRFSERVQDYISYRPGYPNAAIDYICKTAELETGMYVADFGSGTGISSKYFVDRGFTVFGIEPNTSMRNASINHISSNRFISLEGTENLSGIEANTIKLIIAAQVFHWFDREGFLNECNRILTTGGYVCLIWNDRNQEDYLQRRYTSIIDTYNIDYYQIHHHRITEEVITEFFSPFGFQKKIYEYKQLLDLQGLIGRLASCSYMPNRGQENFEKMGIAAKELFNEFQSDGIITFAYQTRIYIGRLK